MKKTQKIIVGILLFIGAAFAVFYFFIKDKVSISNPLLGNSSSTNNTEITTLAQKISALETDLKNKISAISPVNSTTITGATIHTGAGSPASTLGANKDLYFDTTNGYTFIKIDGGWQYSATGIYDGGSDEYNSELASFLRPASVGAVAQIRDLVYNLIQLKTYPDIAILDGVDYESSQGVAEINIAPVGFETYGEEYILPIYKVINSALMLTINLTGTQASQVFSNQVFPNSMLVPRKVDGEWTYLVV
ncbi:hypothetical protein LV89_01841 [Arcicella aurantiaca]|uniref:Uncharacterized protein n=1 Tax=Arcicella aurantiaca TaxID=591202 RepID=A0A316EED9_9BACT|nr:hypothetical protein [Arcicella aurantiaca]PWK27029.1 hypothetical protein LV89_01841 [Arcicella aurantiaca]